MNSDYKTPPLLFFVWGRTVIISYRRDLPSAAAYTILNLKLTRFVGSLFYSLRFLHASHYSVILMSACCNSILARHLPIQRSTSTLRGVYMKRRSILSQSPDMSAACRALAIPIKRVTSLAHDDRPRYSTSARNSASTHIPIHQSTHP